MIITDIFDKGGPIVWILAGYSFIALTIIFERFSRFLFLRKPRKTTEQFLKTQLNQPQTEQTLAYIPGPEGRLLRGIYSAWQEGVKDLNRVAVRIGSLELVTLERGFRTLSFLGNTAPLLGLLGTILGMIKAFMVIEQAGGQVDAPALAGGIWEAMLTTGVGLAVAIPIFLLLHVFESLVDRKAHSMRHYASLMLEYLPNENASDESTNQAKSPSHHRDGVIHAV